jgi:hypothetical protein
LKTPDVENDIRKMGIDNIRDKKRRIELDGV